MPTSVFSITSDADDAAGSFTNTFYPPTSFSAFDDSGGAAGPARLFSSPNYTVANLLLRWNTSSIPDGDAITAAELRIIYVALNGNADSLSVIGDWVSFDGEPLVAGNATTNETYDAIAPQPVAGFPGVPATVIMPIADLTGISKSGYTGLRLKLTGTTPTGINAPDFAVFEHATHPPPELRVTHGNFPDYSLFPKNKLRPFSQRSGVAV